jgi:thiamine biosynthesis lipoprotein
MGTIAEIIVVHADREKAQSAADDAIRTLQLVESRMTRFRGDSDVGRVNRVAGSRAVDVSDDTAFVLHAALHWARSSDGLFDPCYARAIELWDVAHRTVPPPESDAHRFARRQLYSTIDITELDGICQVGLHNADSAIDLGGIAKGHGVDLAVAALRRHGIENAIVDVGGDLYALGQSPEGRDWNIGIRSPSHPSKIDRIIPISNRAVATSGDYMQYFDYRGRRYHHILDTRTGEPSLRKNVSVTVIAERCIDADAGATATFAVAQTEAERILAIAAPGSSTIRIG